MYLELLYVLAGEPCREVGKPGGRRVGGTREFIIGDANPPLLTLTWLTIGGGSRALSDLSFLADSDMAGGWLSSGGAEPGGQAD